MSLVWRGSPDLRLPRPGWADRLRAGARGAAILGILVAGLGLLLLVRAVEQALPGRRRRVSPAVTVAVCRSCLRVLGLRVLAQGRPMHGPGAVVANHSSWLDILVLNAGQRVVFVSKAEVAGWPGIGLLARATGTVFIRREARAEVARQAAAIGKRLAAGETLLFFPEGTSTDGRRVLRFKSALFASLLAPAAPADLAVQPVSLAWRAPEDADPRFYGWWGGAAFGPSALAILGAARQGHVRVVYHPPIPAAACPDRKALAEQAEATVRGGLEAAGVSP